MGFQSSPHENAGPAAPDAGLNEISRHFITKHLLDAGMQVVQAFQPNHSFSFRRPISAFFTPR
jgi:hypothetical protein